MSKVSQDVWYGEGWNAGTEMCAEFVKRVLGLTKLAAHLRTFKQPDRSDTWSAIEPTKSEVQK